MARSIGVKGMNVAAVAILPWVTIPQRLDLQGFEFVPINLSEIDGFITDNRTVTCIISMLNDYVNLLRRPINSCTFIAKPRSKTPWYIRDEDFEAARAATRTLALAALAEQRFFEGHLTPHINASVFDPIVQRLAPPDTRIALSIPWRDGGLNIGGPGLKFGQVCFVEPFQAYRTECPMPNQHFLCALQNAWHDGANIWPSIQDAISIWLLANREDVTLSTEACLTLSAIAFEKLLSSGGTGLKLSEKFAELWKPYVSVTMDHARKARVDEKYHDEQKSWTIGQKWSKELYERRSSFVHNGDKPELSVNWESSQHLVLSAFSFPLTIKLMLHESGYYHLSTTDEARCSAFEVLLDRWDPQAENPLNDDNSWAASDDLYGRPSWSNIVSTTETFLGLEKAIRKEIDKRDMG